MRNSINTLLRALIIFIGMAVLLTAYYWVHRPFDIQPGSSIPDAAVRFGGALLDLFTVGVIFAAAGGLGRRLLARLDMPTRAERFALEGGIGLGGIALVALLLGLVGLFRGAVFAIGLIVALILLRQQVLGWLRDGRALLRSIRLESTGVTLMVVFAGILLIMALIMALTPPAHWDGLTYHLVAVQRYLRDGRILAQADNFYLGLSQNVEMLYGVAIGLFGRDTTAAPIHWGIGLLALIGVAGLTRRFAGHAAAWLAVILLLSAYNLWALMGWSYIDLGNLLFGTLALIASVRWRETRGRGWIIVMGVILGLAMGVKYTAAGLGVGLGVFLLVHEPRQILRNGAVFGIAAALAFGLWAVKGTLLYGNPVYPFFFNGLNWDATRAAAFSFADRSLLALGNGWQIPIIPVAATVFGQDNNDGFGFTAGAWLLTSWLLLPLVWRSLDERARRLAKDGLTLLLPLIGFWMVMSAWSAVGIQTRLMLMSLPAFAVTGALGFAGLANFPKKPIDINWMVRAAFAVTFALSFIDKLATFTREQSLPYLMGQVTVGDFMYSNTGAYYGALQNLSTLPAGSQVRFLWEPRTYHCPETVTCIPDILFDHWVRPQFAGAAPDEVFAQFRDSGDDYVLFFHAGYDVYTTFSHHSDLDRLFPQAIEQAMTPVWTDGLRYTLYTWKTN